MIALTLIMINAFGNNVDAIGIVLQTDSVTQPSLPGPLVKSCYFLHKQLLAFLMEVRRVNVYQLFAEL